MRCFNRLVSSSSRHISSSHSVLNIRRYSSSSDGTNKSEVQRKENQASCGIDCVADGTAKPVENVEQWLLRVIQDPEECHPEEEDMTNKQHPQGGSRNTHRIERLAGKSPSSSMAEKSKEPYLSLSRRFLSTVDAFKRTPSSEASAELSIWPDVHFVEDVLVSSYEEIRSAVMTREQGKKGVGELPNETAQPMLPDRVIVIISHSHSSFSDAVQNSMTRIAEQAARMIETHQSALCTVTVFNGYRPMSLSVLPDGRVDVCGLAANGAPVLCFPEGGVYSLCTLLRSMHTSFQRTSGNALPCTDETPSQAALPLEWRVFILSDSFFHMRTLAGMFTDSSAESTSPERKRNGSNCFKWSCDATPYTITPAMSEQEEIALSRYLYASAVE